MGAEATRFEWNVWEVLSTLVVGAAIATLTATVFATGNTAAGFLLLAALIVGFASDMRRRRTLPEYYARREGLAFELFGTLFMFCLAAAVLSVSGLDTGYRVGAGLLMVGAPLQLAALRTRPVFAYVSPEAKRRIKRSRWVDYLVVLLAVTSVNLADLGL